MWSALALATLLNAAVVCVPTEGKFTPRAAVMIDARTWTWVASDSTKYTCWVKAPVAPEKSTR